MPSASSQREKWFAAFVVFLSSGAVIPAIRMEQGVNLDEGDPIVRVIWLGVFAIVSYFAIAHRTTLGVTLKRNWPLVALVATGLFSVTWSAAPAITLRHSIALIGTTLVGTYIGTRFTLRGQLDLLVKVLGACAILSVVFVFLIPHLGLSTDIDAGAWRGVFTHKNSLGRCMLLCALTFALHPGLTLRVKCVGVIGCALLIWYSRSVTSLVLLVMMLSLLPIFQSVRANAKWLWWAVGAVALGFMSYASWLATHLDVVFDALNRDLTLTGRVPLWIGSFDAISQRPWLGYGYGAFWLGPNSEAYWVWQTAGWEAPHAHNGFLDLWLGVGTLGGLLFFLSYLIAFVGAWRWLKASRTTAGMWPLAYLLFMLVSNLTESAILEQNSLFWIMYVAVVLKCKTAPFIEPVAYNSMGTAAPQTC